MAAAVNGEVIARRRDAEFGKENLRHFFVEMLSGVDQDFLKCPVPV